MTEDFEGKAKVQDFAFPPKSFIKAAMSIAYKELDHRHCDWVNID